MPVLRISVNRDRSASTRDIAGPSVSLTGTGATESIRARCRSRSSVAAPGPIASDVRFAGRATIVVRSRGCARL